MPGAFSQPVLEYSEKTRRIVKNLINESKLNSNCRHKFEQSLSNGTPLPAPVRQNCESDKTSKFRSVNWKFKRSKERIDYLNTNRDETLYIPDPPKYNEKSKELCQDLMAYEGAIDSKLRPDDSNKGEKHADVTEELLSHRKKLISEIEERKLWLAKMEKLGQAEKYRNFIHGEIAQKIRDFQFLNAEARRPFT